MPAEFFALIFSYEPPEEKARYREAPPQDGSFDAENVIARAADAL
jgi:hypothetical protein